MFGNVEDAGAAGAAPTQENGMLPFSSCKSSSHIILLGTFLYAHSLRAEKKSTFFHLLNFLDAFSKSKFPLLTHIMLKLDPFVSFIMNDLGNFSKSISSTES